MHASTPAEYGKLIRWYHIPVFLAITAQMLFVHYYLGSSRVWLLWGPILARAVVVAVNFVVEPNLNFSSITALRHMTLLGDQVIAVGAAVPRPGWQWFAMAGTYAMTAYFIDAAVRRWRGGGQDSKRKSLAIILGIAVPMSVTLAYNQLVMLGVLHVPLSNLPWFVGALLVMAIELGRDFVVSRRALDRLAELQSQLAQAERINALGQLGSTLIHEMTQPLAATVLNAETAQRMLNHSPLDIDGLRAVLADISHDGRRGRQVINRMRQFVGQHAVAMQPLQFDDLANEVISMVRPKAASDKVTLSLQMPPDLPRVMGDRVHLSQVLLNLLMNGIQAAQSCPSNARQVVVEAYPDRGNVQIAVRDSGAGISEDIAEKLFTPFFTTKSEGMGMGLALSRTIIEAHGGHLWLERMDKQDGAVFCFTLHCA